MRFARSQRRTPRIDMSPLIDVVFQLLLFYAVTTQFIADQRLKLQLPKASTAEREATQREKLAEVVVTAKGEILIGGHAVNDQDLPREIRTLLARSPERALTIRGDRGADYGKVVHVLDAARAAGAKAINLAAVKPPEPAGPH
jgi:biopolymer transport protein ExbD